MTGPNIIYVQRNIKMCELFPKDILIFPKTKSNSNILSEIRKKTNNR